MLLVEGAGKPVVVVEDPRNLFEGGMWVTITLCSEPCM